ncbi:MAG: XdhC family protein [Planctomycetaceae bacterium]
MTSLLQTLVQAVSAGRGVCYTALVETRGSTPQKAGAQMLVFSDGSQAGTLGGGCVEADVKRQALERLTGGGSRVLSFTLDHDYGWDDGLICGGRMQMLVDPCPAGSDVDYYRRYSELVDTGAGCTEVVAIEPTHDGLNAGAQLLFDAQGELTASRGVNREAVLPATSAVQSVLRPLAMRPRPYQANGLSFLTQLPRCRLVIVGGGHVGQRVAQLASEVDFDVWVFDDRESYCRSELFPTAAQRVCAPFETALSQLTLSASDFCIIVTRGHQHDQAALFQVVNKPARYLGMIGSKRKIRMIFDDLRRAGVSDDTLRRVHAPLGLDIGSQTVPEIAVSIVAELIAERNNDRRRASAIDSTFSGAT